MIYNQEQLAKEVKRYILANRLTPSETADRLGITTSTVHHIQRKNGIYIRPQSIRNYAEERKQVDAYIAELSPAEKELIEIYRASRVANRKVHAHPMLFGHVQKLASSGFMQITIARAFGLDPITVSRIVRGTHAAQIKMREAEPPTPLQVEMFETEEKPQPKPGLFRRLWIALFG